MKKIFSLILTVLILALSLSSCFGDDSLVLFFAVEAQAGSFDPQIASDSTALLIVRNCFEGLVRHDENGEITEGVAESWSLSDDGLTYTFKLRADAAWHLTSYTKEQLADKLPENFDLSVSADDFVFALRRAVAPETGAGDSYMLMNIEGADEIMSGAASRQTLAVRAVDSRTLEIRLKCPQSNFLDVLTRPVAMPCNEVFFNACSGRYGTYIKFLISNGPFYLSRFNESSYRINRASDYGGKSPAKPDAVWFYIENDRENLLAQLEEDEYSGAVLNSYSFESLKLTKNMRVQEISNVLRCFVFNLKDSVFSDENMRKAFVCATDTTALSASAGKSAAEGFVPSCAASDKVLRHPQLYSEEKAAAYLSTALAALDRQSVNVSVLCESEYEGLIRRLLQEWQRILGINVSLSVRAVEKAQLDSLVSAGGYQIVFYPVTAHADNAYEYFGSFTAASAFNFTGYSDAMIAQLLSQLHSGGEEKFISVYEALENKLASDSIMLPVWEEHSYFVTTKNVSGLIFEAGGDKLYLHNALS